MMKKTLILASLLAVTMSSAVFAQETATPAAKVVPAAQQEQPQKTTCEKQKPPRHESEFEKRLKLTDAQKQQAKEIRMKGHKAIKPVMEQIKQKKDEIEAVKRSRIAVQMQEEKIEALKSEIRELHKKAHEIRVQNMKEFEAILTKKQLKELEKMKKEGRKKFEKEFKKGHHPDGPRPDFKPGYGPQPPHHGHGPQVPPPPPVEK